MEQLEAAGNAAAMDFRHLHALIDGSKLCSPNWPGRSSRTPDRLSATPQSTQRNSALQHTVDVTPRAAELLAAIVAGPLADPATLPTPTDAERKPPKE